MPGISGEETLAALKKEHELLEVIILTGHGSIDSAIETTKMGAYLYLQKPCDLERLLEVLVDAYKKKVMNKMKIKENKMNELMNMATTSSPLSILERIKELDKENNI